MLFKYFEQPKLLPTSFIQQLIWIYKVAVLVKCSAIVYLLTTLQVTAQIVPDGTLPSNSTITNEGNSTVINGGTRKDGNLFHSFEQFSIPTGGSAYFNNATDIQNIFSRITGEATSNIDGLIRANSRANLFLLNPNGIIFGANAALNIGGSFLASTANNINFADGIQFSASSPQTTPLLTVSVPIGLGFGSNPGNIGVQGNGQGLRQTIDPIDTTSGLRVQPDRTLALVGGDLKLDGGTLKTAGGRIELGSVAGSASVSLTPIDKGYTLGYSDVPSFGNIHLSGQTAVDASGIPSGDIQLTGRQISVAGGSQIESSTLGSATGGTLNVTATDLVELVGASPNAEFLSSLGTSTYPGTTGNGGSIAIKTGRLSVRDGSQIGVTTSGTGSAGSVSIKAKDSVELVGALPNGRFVSGIITAAQKGSTGNSGSFTLETGNLSIRDGATISTTAFSMGSPGSAGSISIKANSLVELAGVSPGTHTPSTIVSNTNRGTTGNGGNITIETGSLSVRDGSQIGSATFGKGSAGNVLVKAKDSAELVGVSSQFPSSIIAAAQAGSTGNSGNLTLETGNLSIRDGAVVGVGTSGSGSAGNLLVRAKDSVELVGSTTDGRPSRLSVRTAASGNAGDLTIETRHLTVQDGASVSATSEGTGEAGQLRVQASSIQLNNQAKLNAESSSGEGGNIFLRSHKLQLLKGSSITTSVMGGLGNGGNINLDTDLLTLTQASSITANAFGGNGGNININASGLFQSPDSAITATSQLGINGTVQFNRIEKNPTTGTVELPIQPLDATGLIAQGCPGNLAGKSSSFTITGRGGLADDPYKPLNVEPRPWVDLRSFASNEIEPSTPANNRDLLSQSKSRFSFEAAEPVSFAQADHVLLDSQGNVVLASSAPKMQSLPSPNCQVFDRTDK